jgi:hypothetical protein
MREKAQWVLGEMERRLFALDLGWADVSATHVYSVYDIHPLMETELVGRGAAKGGITWQFCRPPLDVLDYEMDVRSVALERIH